MADFSTTMWSIKNTSESTLSNTRKIQGEVAALAVMAADLQHQTKQISSTTDNMNAKMKEVEKKTEDIQRMVYELYDRVNRQHNMQMAQTEIVKVRQEREKLYGGYDKVRKNAEGILLATDIGVVRQNTIVTSAEELMIATPKYWLSACLLALSAWINDDKKTADKAIKAAIQIDDEKTCLFFALVSRRAGRGSACCEWIIRYLRGQDPENLDMRCVFVLDAYANGLFGVSGGKSVFDYMSEWVNYLSQKDDFEQQQIKNWKGVIQSIMTRPSANYPVISQFCTNKYVYETKLTTAYLHGNLYRYIDEIMSVPVDTGILKEKLDEILKELVTLFDDDERSMVYKELEMEYIIKFQGDKNKANSAIQLDRSKFEDTRNFTQILTDVAKGDNSEFNSPSTRKLSVAFCRDWIKSSYNDILATNRTTASLPLKFNVNGFCFETKDGRNFAYLYSSISEHLKEEYKKECATTRIIYEEKRSDFQKKGGILISLGVLALLVGFIAQSGLFLCGALVLGIFGGYNFYQSSYTLGNELESSLKNIEAKNKNKETTIKQKVNQICSEVTKLDRTVKEKEKDELATRRLLDELSPELYVSKYADDKVRYVMLRK